MLLALWLYLDVKMLGGNVRGTPSIYMNCLFLQNPFYTVQKLAGLLELGIYYWYYIQKLIWTNISVATETVFLFHCILHGFHFYWFGANLKPLKTAFYHLTYIFVALQNVVTFSLVLNFAEYCWCKILQDILQIADALYINIHLLFIQFDKVV